MRIAHSRLASGLASKTTILVASLAASAGILAADISPAQACGCFAPPDPSVPIVQSGERILFAMEDGVVTSHIQIQYNGDAEEFAWLVPLPAVPTLELGTDELFAQVINTTQPKYRLISEDDGFCDDAFNDSPAAGGGRGDNEGAPPPAPNDPLVTRDTAGPYDYAVLRADSKQPMLDWLEEERFFVPAGTDDAVDPYIREGSYFLALKLRKGESVGDLLPVVVKYESELPMIPIVLTSVAADPDMPVMVWVLGDARAIPRNFFHTEINDARIDWLNAGSNYIDVITRAVDEADGHHSFVTEYAGSSDIMRGVLDFDGRFGDLGVLSEIVDPDAYVNYLQNNGYGSATPPFFNLQYSTPMIALLEKHLPMPAELADTGLDANSFYISFSYFLDEYRNNYPEQAETLYADFDPAALTAEIDERIVTPTLDAGQLFRDHPVMTRLFTTLSPDEMTKDPVLSFNPNLPDVSNIHEARLVRECRLESNGRIPRRIITEQGWVLRLPDEGGNDWLEVDMPNSLRIEVLREEGAPEVTADYESAIDDAIEDHRPPRTGGCSAAPDTTPRGLAAMLLRGLGVALNWRRRRV